MPNDNWLIYGAYGYTGLLLVEEAIRRGHKPLLAGRSASKLAPLAEQFGLDWVAFDLSNMQQSSKIIANVDLVFHAAGPFIHTTQAILGACLVGKTHYLDISGETSVIRHVFSQHQVAQHQGITLLPAAGFNVIATDCLAKYVANQIVNPTHLEIAIAGNHHFSIGSAKTMLEIFAQGMMIREDGELRPFQLGQGTKQTYFPHGQYTVMPLPLADLVTAYQSTHIPNIITYLAYPQNTIPLFRLLSPFAYPLVSIKVIRRLLQVLMKYIVKKQNNPISPTKRAYIWAKAKNQKGAQAEAWLDTQEVYQFTAISGIRCVEKVLTQPLEGAFTPALAFDTDFILEIEGVKRFDRLLLSDSNQLHT